MKEEYAKIIGELDISLKLVTGMWIEARTEDKRKINERINELLDERLRLMKIRDSHDNIHEERTT